MNDPAKALGELPASVNMASFLSRMSAEFPEREAVIVAARGGRWDRIRYAELEGRSNAIARGLRERGVRKGARACLFVRPGIDLIACTYALFKLGAVPVLMDPGVGRERLLEGIARMRPGVFIGVPRAQAARVLFPKAFESVELNVTVGPRLLWGGTTLARLARESDAPLDWEPTGADDEAAILFTSGSTGPPKGVLYTHGMFFAQVLALSRLYRFEPGEVDLACFPLFALFDTAFAMTAVFPELDPTRPAACDPTRIYAAAQETGATTSFGSPAIWRQVVPWCLERGFKLDGLKRVLVAGAPVSTELIHDFHAVLPMDGDVYTPYGATEALPVTSIEGRDVVPALLERVQEGEGTCVGAPAPGIDLRLIEIQDGPIPEWSDELEVPRGELGEVCVRGPVVAELYVADPKHTALAKIPSPQGTWHRMGDMGRLDEEGRLWFFGRKAHRLQTRGGVRMPVPTENVFNTHPRVLRTALVGVGEPGAEEPLVVVEPLPGELPKTDVMTEAFVMQLRTIGQKRAVTRDVESFLFHPGFPVDPRHNAKIDREQLKLWAEDYLS